MSPQFTPRTHRARDRLAAVPARWPHAWELVDLVRQQHAATWPPHIYLPMPAASGVLTAQHRRLGMPDAPRHGRVGEQVGDAYTLAALAAWRMTQGIYRYDPALYAALVDTPLGGDIPAGILQRLPEWCVYIETPGMTIPVVDGTILRDLPAPGAWLWLDYDHDADKLLIGWDVDLDTLPVTVVPLVGTLDAAVDRVLDHWAQARVEGAATDDPHPAMRAAYRRCVPPVLSLALYLCSEAPDLTRRGRIDTPENPTPVRTRRHGWRLFPAAGSREWDVGVRIGAALRDAYQREQTGGDASLPSHSVRPHVRRAHWHTFVSGATKRADGTVIPASERRRDLRWLPPIPVALDDVAQLPAVVRSVK